MSIKQTIEEIVEKHLPDEKHFIVDVQVIEGKGKPQVKILLDADQGIQIDTCAFVSRQVGEEIEAKELLDAAYVLEVSSPGVDYPLSSRRQYQKNIGRNLKVTFTDGREAEGELLGVEPTTIKLSVKKKEKGKKVTTEEVEISLEEIKKSIVLVSFK
ncbi:ribosome maturation factor RimP [Belliella kenyensis]|uniref:Ribosome maturation factor RimP n=1 Tax=Belliella kenyensis TaxID=1472724 RepID=A0ABV8EGP4_9BACT|nr:ribosome maturation factor RimP [Belliella kenyensis]MCH7402324.1 ribosome maturation factor RimP [Belliella kenyensis]MDN3603515.1 ribosome maturation factor RimP [Belliella kenyensis]